MQLFELILVLSIIIIVPFRSIWKRYLGDKSQFIISSVFVLLLLLHFLLDGYRWQMIPIYLAMIAYLVVMIAFKDKGFNRALKFSGYFFFALSVIIGNTLSFLLPVFELPEPTGSYGIGTANLYLKLDRDEPITGDPNDRRELDVKVWYPSNIKEGEEDSYIDKASREGFAIKYGLPSSSFNYLDRVNTGVYRSVKPVEGKFPVLIFSHGYHSKATGYYSILKEIVSHGYVIFNINHTYESPGTTFPDGRSVYFHSGYARSIETPEEWGKISEAVESFGNMNFEERHPLVRKALNEYFVAEMEERWSQDIIEVIDQLEVWNKGGMLKGILDLNSIGVFGHSRGGGSSGVAILKDDRIKAASNIDGVQWGEIVDTIFQKPFLYISSDWPDGHQDLSSHAYINKSTDFFYEAELTNSGHSNFMDIPYMILIPQLTGVGTIPKERATNITNELLLAFFNKHLKNLEVDVSNIEKTHEELGLEIFKGDSVRLE
ncbi:MAG: hypothetical protein AAF363_19680 [Bacteroidota bacterium]